MLICLIPDFGVSIAYFLYDYLDKLYSAALLIISMHLLRIEIRKMQSPEFFWREKLMTLHSVLFISYMVALLLARSI